MRYEKMLPHQIRAAIAANTPVILPLGVLEYHGEHMAVGMDTLAVTCALDILEKEADIVILPPFYYGAASYAVEPPEGTGSARLTLTIESVSANGNVGNFGSVSGSTCGASGETLLARVAESELFFPALKLY